MTRKFVWTTLFLLHHRQGETTDDVIVAKSTIFNQFKSIDQLLTYVECNDYEKVIFRTETFFLTSFSISESMTVKELVKL